MLSRKAVNLNQKKVHSSRVISFIIRETHADTQIVTISMSPMAVVRISVVYVMTKMLTPVIAWATRTLIVRKLKGLEDLIGMDS